MQAATASPHATQQNAPQPSPLGLLIGLLQRVRRAASFEEVRFIMVNQTMMLSPYRQAIVWAATGDVLAVSGVSSVEANSPFTLWLNRMCGRYAKTLTAPAIITHEDLPEGEREQWADWFPAHALLLPLDTPKGERLGMLILVRDEIWQETELMVLSELAEFYAYAWAWHSKPSLWKLWQRKWEQLRQKRPYWLAIPLLILLFPVHLSVLASGEVVARDPAVLRSPLTGVVEKVLVEPNQSVSEGQPLFNLDTTSVRGDLDVAKKELSTAQAEYEQTAQQAFSDMKAKGQLGVLQSRIEERRAAVARLSDVLERSHVKAPRAGIAVLDDPSEWIGKPVTTGERIMAIADEHDTEVEAWITPADAVNVPAGSPVTLFLNIDPLHPVSARLRYVEYESQPRPDGTMGHRVRASIAPGETLPRLGLKGTARVDGPRVPLIYWVLRRPWAVIRQTLGL